ncbi:MAG TPA: flagellar hook-associated protein FlgK [Smithellaceae bacterium]|nr:flagellar hook-associated protein FlgK [Smithellaceae bacterium]
MADISRVLFTAKEALLSNLTAINVTGSNIANVNTPGYSRLRPMFESVGTKDASSAQEQIGVRIADIERIYDRYLELQMVSQQSPVANYSTQKDLLQRIEGILNENIEGGINDALGNFLNAWGDLSVDPSSQAKRDMVVSSALSLSATFNQRSNEIIDIQMAADETVADTVSTLNEYLRQMADFNELIVNAESAGASASAIRDQRGELLGKISSIIDISYLEKTDGSLYIYLPTNGKALVENFNSWDLGVFRNPANNNMYDVVFAENPTDGFINDQIIGGKLAGLLEVRDRAIPSYLDSLNQTASAIVNKINDLHISGYDQNGEPGGLFFNVTATARSMSVNSEIMADTRMIVASSTINSDGNIAAQMAAIKNDQMYASLGSVTTTGAAASGRVNNIGQAYKDTIGAITLTRGAAPDTWTVTGSGGYSSLSVLSADGQTLSIDLNGNGTSDISFALSGAWGAGDTLSFSLAKNPNTTTIDGYFNSFISNMGQDVVNASRALDRETTILNQQTNQREQLSGVSLDEEMINLIKYQMAYSAAGRMTKTVSEMMDIIINLGQ